MLQNRTAQYNSTPHEQHSFSTKTDAIFFVEGTSIAGFAVKKSDGLK
jgi:hypothetical protein